MKRLSAFLLALLLPIAALAQSPGVGLDALPSASALGGGELFFVYQPGSGGSGAAICARGWCPVSATPLQVATYITGLGRFTTITGAITTGHCVEWASATSLEDAGAACGSGGGSSAFNALTGGTNTTAAMIVGTGASLDFSGGTINASSLAGATFASPGAIGGTAPAAGSFTALSATGALTTNVTGSTQCLHANSSGVVSGAGADCLGITQLTGDVTAGPGAGSVAASVIKVNGAAVPASATVLASNSSRQIIAAANVALYSGAFTVSDCVNVASTSPVTFADAGSACGAGGGGSAFSAITSGVNTTAVMVVDTGASLSATGSGTIAATTAEQLAALPSACTGGQFSTGNDVFGNAICSTPSGSGTVNSGLTGNAAYYPSNGTAVSPLVVGANTILGGVGSGVAALTPAQVIGVLGSGTCNAQTISYQLVLGDANLCVTENSASATTVTIPLNATVAFPVGTSITVQQLGTGTVSVAIAGGVTMQQAGAITFASLGGQFGFESFQKVATDTWQLAGQGLGNTLFTVAGSCTTPSATAGGATGGTITLAASGTTHSCTLIVTPGGGLTTGHMWLGNAMCDQTQPTVPCWPASSQNTTSVTYTIPTATAASDVLTYSTTPE